MPEAPSNRREASHEGEHFPFAPDEDSRAEGRSYTDNPPSIGIAVPVM